MKYYDHSFHAFIQGVILIGFALLILALVLSGNIVYYIAPTMMPFVYFSLITFFILGIVQVLRSMGKNEDHDHDSCNCEHDHQIKGPTWVKLMIYSIFILPVVFGFTLPDQALDSSIAANRGIQFGSGIGEQTETSASETAEKSNEDQENGGTSRADAYLEDPDAYLDSLGSTSQDDDHVSEDVYDENWSNEDYFRELAEDLLKDDKVIVTETNYLDVMTVFDLYLDKFIGKEVELIGFVYRESDFDSNQIVAARFAMTCCTADAGVYGTLVESDNVTQFEDDSWISATGVIDEGDYHGQVIPVITNATITEIEEPNSPYVYPSY
ncbi:TIGR03943 family putative permease subunit [Salipaludibacillus sp. HK11]|uniref:TIGR03943 family putative permease subunit n=1 Tax=Salipaludibacillus sp. HK11 TaxID=3394320 RepID=UPI0039FC456B